MAISQYVMHFIDPSAAPFVVNPYTSNGLVFPTAAGALDPSASGAATSLLFYGKGHPNYGERIEENFLHLLETFSGSIAPANPVSGQLWYTRIVYLQVAGGAWYQWTDGANVDGGSWSAVTVTNSSPPVQPVNGDHYFNAGVLYRGVDIAGHPLPANWYPVAFEIDSTISAPPSAATIKPKKILRVYDGGTWRETNTMWYGATSPANPVRGSVWFNTGSSSIEVYDGTVWVSSTGNFVEKTGDTMTGTLVMSGAEIDMTNNKIVNLALPTDDTDAASKIYVDSVVGSFVPNIGLDDLNDVVLSALPPTLGEVIRFNGGNWTNAELVLGDISDVTATATELSFLSGVTSNVQAQITSLGANKVDKAGDVITGALVMSAAQIDMGGNKIINVANPTDPGDAVNLQYLTTNSYRGLLSIDNTTSITPGVSPPESATLTFNFSSGPPLLASGLAPQVHTHLYTPAPGELLDNLPVPPETIEQAIHNLDKVVKRKSTPKRVVATPIIGPGVVTVPQYEVGSNSLFVFINGLKAIASISGHQSVQFDLSQTGSPVFAPNQLDCTTLAGLFDGEVSTTYEFSVTIDGTAPQTVSINGDNTALDTFCSLVAEINNQLSGATAVLEDSAITIYSDSTGPTSTILINDAVGPSPLPLFGSMSFFDSFSTPEVGSTHDYTEIGPAATLSTTISLISVTGGSPGDTLEAIVLGGTGAP